MARAPFQVLVYPYRKTREDGLEYALLKRSDAGYWQGIAGGGEDNETLLEAARREAYEEQAYALAKYDGNKTALWELDRRLRGQPRG